MTVRSGGQVLWEGPLFVPVHSPFLVIAGQRLLRDGKPSPPPLTTGDQAVELEIALANLGTGHARKVRLTLSSPVEGIRITTPVLDLGDLKPGERRNCPLRFPVAVAEGSSPEAVEFILAVAWGDTGRREEMFTVADPPAVPEDLAGEAGAASVKLRWEPVVCPRLAGYEVWRAETSAGPWRVLNILPLKSSCFEDPNVEARRTYFYRVTALDRDLNASPPSAHVAVATTFPLLRDWPKKTGSPLLHVTVADVDGDGDMEIAAGDDKTGLWIWHHTGEELRHGGDNWTFGLFRELPHGAGTPTFADLDGDGTLEVLCAGKFKDHRVYAFRLDGTDLPGWPKTVQGRLMTPPQPADFNGDGRPEVLFHEGFGKNLYLWRGDGSAFIHAKVKGKMKPKEIIAKTNPFTYYISSLVDLDGDGRLDIVGLGGKGQVYAVRADGTPLGGFPKVVGKGLGSTAPVGDIDGDGRPDIVFVSDGGTKLYALRHDGSDMPGFPVPVWNHKPGEGASFPALAQMDDKKGLEIVLGGRGGKLFVIDGRGRSLPGFPASLPQQATGAVIGDLDGDGDPQIICACTDGGIYAFHHDGKPVLGFPLRAGAAVNGVPVLADVDGDGDIDLAAGSADGYVYIWDLGAPLDPGLLLWSAYGGDAHRSGASLPVPAPPTRVKILGSRKARITWRAPRKGRVAAYHVYKGAGPKKRRLSKQPLSKLTFVDEDVIPGIRYEYAVTSLSDRGRESLFSEPVFWGDEAVKALFDKAARFEKRKIFKEAIRAYREVMSRFPASPRAREAKVRVTRLEADTGVQENLSAQRMASWCRGMMSLARTWKASGKMRKAAECFRRVRDRYPGTRWAREAEKELAEIGEGR